MKKLGVSLMSIGVTVLFSIGVLALPEDGLMLHFAFDGGSVDGDTVKDLSMSFFCLGILTLHQKM